MIRAPLPRPRRAISSSSTTPPSVARSSATRCRSPRTSARARGPSTPVLQPGRARAPTESPGRPPREGAAGVPREACARPAAGERAGASSGRALHVGGHARVARGGVDNARASDRRGRRRRRGRGGRLEGRSSRAHRSHRSRNREPRRLWLRDGRPRGRHRRRGHNGCRRGDGRRLRVGRRRFDGRRLDGKRR